MGLKGRLKTVIEHFILLELSAHSRLFTVAVRIARLWWVTNRHVWAGRFGHRHVCGEVDHEEDEQQGHTALEGEMELSLWKLFRINRLSRSGN